VRIHYSGCDPFVTGNGARGGDRVVAGVDRFMSQCASLTNLAGNAWRRWWWHAGERTGQGAGFRALNRKREASSALDGAFTAGVTWACVDMRGWPERAQTTRISRPFDFVDGRDTFPGGIHFGFPEHFAGVGIGARTFSVACGGEDEAACGYTGRLWK